MNSLGHRNLILSFATCSLLLLHLGCRGVRVSQQNQCPAAILAGPALDGAGIRWGGNEANVSATVAAVVVECIPVHHDPIEIDKVKRADYADYQLAATATVTYKIADLTLFENATKYGDLEAILIFEAVTASGVVLSSATSSFKVVQGGTTGTVSAKITGLSSEEIRRVSRVQVKWRYGR